MPTTDAEDVQSFMEGTKNAANKLVRKYTAATQKTIARLQSPDTQEAWEKAMLSDEAKKGYEQGRKNVTAQQLKDGMEQKGKQNYVTSTGSKVALDKWARNGKEYRDAAKAFSEEKPIATTTAEQVENMRVNMLIQKNIRRAKLGLAPEG